MFSLWFIIRDVLIDPVPGSRCSKMLVPASVLRDATEQAKNHNRAGNDTEGHLGVA